MISPLGGVQKRLRRIIVSVQVLFLFRSRRYKDAERLVRKYLVFSERDSFYHEWLAKTLWKQDRLSEAIQEYRVTIGLQPAAFFMDRFDLIELLFEAQQYEEVIAECQKYFDPRFHKVTFLNRHLCEYGAYRGMARAYMALHDYKRAKEAWTHLLPYYKRGRTHAELLHAISVCENELRSQG